MYHLSDVAQRKPLGRVGNVNLAASSWQSTLLFIWFTLSGQIFKKYSTGSSGSLLSRHGPMWYFWCSLCWKILLKEAWETWEDTVQTAMIQLYFIPKEDFLKCFKQWWDFCGMYVQCLGEYFKRIRISEVQESFFFYKRSCTFETNLTYNPNTNREIIWDTDESTCALYIISKQNPVKWQKCWGIFKLMW